MVAVCSLKSMQERRDDARTRCEREPQGTAVLVRMLACMPLKQARAGKAKGGEEEGRGGEEHIVEDTDRLYRIKLTYQ